MKNFTKKSILQKTIIAILVVLLLTNFIAPTIILADDDDVDMDEVGGVLFSPIQFLVLGIGDTLLWIANTCAYGEEVDPIMTLSESWSAWSITKDLLLLISGPLGQAQLGTSIWVELLGVGEGSFLDLDVLPDKIDLPVILVSPEKIFSNEVPLLDANIINPNSKEYTNPDSGETITTPVQAMQDTISSWYVALRNLAVVGLLSVLVYVGIRIIIASTASDKAKYKQMFTDWLIALCILFFMHYIMSFAITMVESLIDSIKQTNQTIEIPISVSEIQSNYNDDGYEDVLNNLTGPNGGYLTDLMGLARFRAQLNYTGQGSNGEDVVAEGGRAQMAYTIIYFVLVIYTIMFLFIYIKRMIYIIFLTMIAPLVALTYPIDKMNDGQAQAFNMWLKEYIFNLLIQPLHLLIYNILLGSTMELASQYMIYPLVVLGFLLPAEKILRKFFGFEKSSTASSIASGALGGAAVMGAINKIGSGAKKAIKAGKGASSSENGGNNTIRMAERKADDPDGEDKFIAESLNGPSEEQKEQLPDGYEQYKQDNPFFEQEQEEGLTPEEMAARDPNYEYMHPELFNNTSDNTDNNMEDEKLDIHTANEENAIPETTYNKGYMTAKEMKEKVSDSKFIKGAKTIGRGLGAVGAKYVAPNLGKAGLGLLKGTAAAIGAGTLGTIGIAAGLASDDYSNVAKYGGAAAAIGASMGGKAGNRLISMPSNAYRKGSEIADTYRQATYSKEQYNKLVNRRLDHEFMRSKENQALYREKFGTSKMTNSNGEQVEAYKVAMEKALDYRAQGVTDNDIIIKAMKVKTKYGNNDNLADRRRIVSAKLASHVSNEKDVENIQKRLKEKGIAEPQIQDQADMIRKIRGLY